MRKLILASVFVLILLGLSASVLGTQWIVPSFNDSSSSEYMNLNYTVLKYIADNTTGVPYKAKIDINGVAASCLQEQANVSTACGGLATGTYNWTGSWSVLAVPTRLIDANYSSRARCTGGNICYMYVNYTKPTGELTGSQWQIKAVNTGADTTLTQNLTVPAGCLAQTKLSFRITSDYNTGASGFGNIWDCWDGSSWDNLHTVYHGVNDAYVRVYEEGMYWQLGTVTNLTINMNDTLIYNYTGIYPTTAQTIDLNLTPCAATFPCEVNFTSDVNNSVLFFDDLKIFIRNYTVGYPASFEIGTPAVFEINVSYSSDFFSNFTCNVSINGVNHIMTPYDETTQMRCRYTHNFQTADAGTATFNFTFVYDGDEEFQTANYSQSVIGFNIGICNATLNWTVINLSYYDEFDDASINVTNSYNLVFSDGSVSTNLTGSFSDNYSDTFCTDLDPSTSTINWDMYGQMILSKTDFITRVFIFNPGTPIVVSNNPQTNTSLYMIRVDNSSTVQYNWLTTEFQLIDGTMRIWKCNDDGSKSLSESVQVINGVGVANIELLTQAYSYDITIDGTLYTDAAGYGACHVESLTTVTYYVEVTDNDVTGLIGFNGIQCSVKKISNNSVRLLWGDNPQTTDFVEGCLRVYGVTVAGSTLVYENCSTQEEVDLYGYNRTIVVALAGNTYTVMGWLQEGDFTKSCGEVTLGSDRPAATTFGMGGVYGSFLLIAAVALFFSGSGELMLMGVIVGIISSWLLGVLALPWIIISTMIIFLVLVMILGRYSRKQ